MHNKTIAVSHYRYSSTIYLYSVSVMDQSQTVFVIKINKSDDGDEGLLFSESGCGFQQQQTVIS